MSFYGNPLPLVYALACALSTVGCCTKSADEAVSLFKRQHRDVSEHYKFILPVSTEIYDIIFNIKSSTITGIGHSMKERFSDNSAITAYAAKILDQEKVANEEWVRNFSDLKEAATGGGVLCEFEWNDGKMREVGLLVLRSGNIIKRQPWFTDKSPQALDNK